MRARAPSTASLAGCLVLACFWFGCDDEGIVGRLEAETCAESCSDGKHCDPTLLECVECAEDGDCSADGAPYCDGFECVACRDAADCPDTAPLCSEGACIACTEDADCAALGGDGDDGDDELECEDGACVPHEGEEDETETETDTDNSGEGGSDSEEE